MQHDITINVHMSVIKKLAGETLIYGMASILPRLLFFLMTLIYLTYRFPNSEDYGEYNELYAYVTILLTILVYRLDTAFFRFGSRDEEDKEVVFGTSLTTVMISTIVLVLALLYFSDSIAHLLDYGDRVHYVQWFSIIIGCDAVASMFYARFRLNSQPKRFLFFRVANVVLTIIFIFLFLEVLPRVAPTFLEQIGNVFGVSKELDYVFLANLVASASIIILLVPDFLKVKFGIDIFLLKRMMIYALPLVLVGLAGNFNQAFAIPLQKYLLDGDIAANLSNAGVYAAAAKVALLLNLFTVAFNYAAEPFFFNNVKGDEKREAYGKIALAFTMVCLIVIIGIVGFSQILQYLVDENYRQAFNLVPILLFAYLFLGLHYNVSIWYKISDHTMIGAGIAIVGAIITFIISAIYLPEIGTAASAYAALVTYAVMVIIGYILGQKYYPIKYPVKKILAYISVTVLMVLHLNYLNNMTSNWTWLVAIFYIVALGSYMFTTEKKSLMG